MITPIGPMADAIRQELPGLHGTLSLWGQCFSRPYSSLYTVVDCTHYADQLTLRFDEGEVLTLWRPHNLQIRDSALVVQHSDRVRWEWVLSDWPKVPGTEHVLELYHTGDALEIIMDTAQVASALKETACPALELR